MNSSTYSRFKIFGALALSLFVLSACKSTETVGTIGGTGGAAANASATPSTSATPTATPTPSPSGASVDAEIYLKLDTAWDQAPSLLTHWTPLLVDGTFPSIPTAAACSVSTGTAPGSDSTPAVTHTCNFHIPEAQMYFSSANFIYGSSDSTNCKILKFDPYFYELNAEANPPAPAATPAPSPYPQTWLLGGSSSFVTCYGSSLGYRPAFPQGQELTEQAFIYITTGCTYVTPTKIAGFPGNVQLVSETKLAQEFNFSVDSASQENQNSNRWLSNDTASKAAAGASRSGEYRLGSIHDYTLQCLNEFGVLTYQIVITITPDHTTGPPATLYRGWR